MARFLPALLLALAALSVSGAAGATTAKQTRQASAESAALTSCGALPLAFVPNAGQPDQRVRFSAQAGNASVWLTRREAVVALARGMRGFALRLAFLGANPGPTVADARRSAGRVNYLIGNDPARWGTNLATYQEVVSRRLWPGVALRVRGQGGQLKHEYRLAPRADPAHIRLRYASSPPSFIRARSYAAGPVPRSLAIGDLNGDGKPDLVTANAAADTVSVLANSGDGTFRPRRDYRVGRVPVSVAIGDLNGDRNPDLATANTGPEENPGTTVSVLMNKGDGSFQAKRDYATGRFPHSLAIGDLNGDGEPDLANLNIGDAVSVLLNRGDGSFQARREYATGGFSSSVAIGDLDGDRMPDLATANISGSVSVLVNRGDGSFLPKRDYTVVGGTTSLAIADLNGDRKPDLATASAPTGISVLLNRGNGSFRASREYATGSEPNSVAIGDLNGDSRPDLATANWRDTVSVLTSKGDGTFRARLDYATERVPQAVRHGPQAVRIGDLNGDRKLDLATANEAGSVSVLLNKPGLCTVQDVKGGLLLAAKRTLGRANCRVWRIRRAYSRWAKKGHVISQKPRFGTVLQGGGKVDLVVSRGRRVKP